MSHHAEVGQGGSPDDPIQAVKAPAPFPFHKGLKRLARSRSLLKWLAENLDVIAIYSNEKLFPVTRVFTHQNNWILAKDAATIDPTFRNVYRMQGMASVMVWAAVASNGKKSPVFWIPNGVKVNQHVYLNFLKTKVAKWIKDEFPGMSVCFMQDGATAHTACLVQDWCQTHF